MKIRILRHINGPGGVDWLPGSEHDCSPALAAELIAARAAELAGPPAPSTGVEILSNDPAVSHRDPQPARKGRR